MTVGCQTTSKPFHIRSSVDARPYHPSARLSTPNSLTTVPLVWRWHIVKKLAPAPTFMPRTTALLPGATRSYSPRSAAATGGSPGNWYCYMEAAVHCAAILCKLQNSPPAAFLNTLGASNAFGSMFVSITNVFNPPRHLHDRAPPRLGQFNDVSFSTKL